MTLEEIKCEIGGTVEKVKNELYKLTTMEKPPKFNMNDFTIKILSKLRTVLGDPIKNPVLKQQDAEDYYFNESYGLYHIQEKYLIIINLQDYIVGETGVPFVYDRYTVLKILQITQPCYLKMLNTCYSGIDSGLNEDVCNLFVDIETMILNDRNLSAENGQKNAKAVDNINRYKKENGGYGVEVQSNKNQPTNNILIVTAEEAQKKLENRFNFSSMIESEEKK